ncbi:alpha/beta hydrolase [Novosphingobium sp. 1949]|uniref:Alpha/beta hydrolase n=1 Tax=Novosphingobium organovorum TaxID=2930092 RepID=A0ABT0BHH4_9SPHN|nr:alpha/beta hydrolase [Novosphingobium organovorum]MCJ2184475.1 alpha/beta hydrolase [Novosphingobium organovorum]
MAFFPFSAKPRRTALLVAAASLLGMALAPVARAAPVPAPLPTHAQIAAAGYRHKVAQVNTVQLSYWEGPDNGPPLVLLHAQFLDWYAYARVLPELARHFHVYDVDYPGHGETRVPADYPMNAVRIGTDLGDFIKARIGVPVFVTGNSSGGLLATWLAANRPELVRKVVLEDPPLFASQYPAIKQTVAYTSFANSYSAVHEDHSADFLLYWIDRSRPFFRKNAGPGAAWMLIRAVEAFERRNPGQPVELARLAARNPTVFMLIRGLSAYDPRFGAAFYDGSWNKGFDHGAALARIRCPVLLLQANGSINAQGRLDGAMTEAQARAAMAQLQHGTYRRVDASHVVNLDKPELWLGAVEDFLRAP